MIALPMAARSTWRQQSLCRLLLLLAVIVSGHRQSRAQESDVRQQRVHDMREAFEYRVPRGNDFIPVHEPGVFRDGTTIRDAPFIIGTSNSHIGYTTKKRPNLYWFSSRDFDSPVRIVIAPANDAAVFTKQYDGGTYGVHLLSLSTENGSWVAGETSLRDGVRYKVAIYIGDPAPNSPPPRVCDIMYKTATPNLIRELKQRDQRKRAITFAEASFFYDAIDAIYMLIRNNPEHDRADCRFMISRFAPYIFGEDALNPFIETNSLDGLLVFADQRR